MTTTAIELDLQPFLDLKLRHLCNVCPSFFFFFFSSRWRCLCLLATAQLPIRTTAQFEPKYPRGKKMAIKRVGKLADNRGFSTRTLRNQHLSHARRVKILVRASTAPAPPFAKRTFCRATQHNGFSHEKRITERANANGSFGMRRQSVRGRTENDPYTPDESFCGCLTTNNFLISPKL